MPRCARQASPQRVGQLVAPSLEPLGKFPERADAPQPNAHLEVPPFGDQAEAAKRSLRRVRRRGGGVNVAGASPLPLGVHLVRPGDHRRDQAGADAFPASLRIDRALEVHPLGIRGGAWVVAK